MAENMALWEALEKTDAKYTKNFKRGGGFGGTDINPAYRLRIMTEAFGLCGSGWGWLVERVWREDFGGKPVVFAQVNLWTGTRDNLTGAQIGGTDAGRTPDEAYKMAITDALGKCMLALGVAADVYLGEFDTKYSRPKASEAPSRTQAPKQAPTPTQTPSKASEAPSGASGEVCCPACAGPMWDNRADRAQDKVDITAGTRTKNPRAAWKCKDKECGGVHWQSDPYATEEKPAKQQDTPEQAEVRKEIRALLLKKCPDEATARANLKAICGTEAPSMIPADKLSATLDGVSALGTVADGLEDMDVPF